MSKLSKVKRIILIVLDSVGVGALPDAGDYGDEGANTLSHIAEATDGLKLPNLERLGLGKIVNVKGLANNIEAKGAFGKMAEKSVGKDTTTGHWELAGIILDKPFPLYPKGFPLEVIEPFKQAIKRGILGNKAASGTEIIQELGQEHIKTKKPIVYTSADSVFQIAAHEEIIPLKELYSMCKKARKILTGKHGVGRVIARPFIGTVGNFVRTAHRKDFSLKPPQETMLDKIKKGNKSVLAVGKISSIFANQGISESIHTVSNMDSVEALLKFMDKEQAGLIFVNLVEFDMNYGHRRDALGYAQALEEFDERLREIILKLNKDDVLIITADHGCDPTFKGTDHTREYVPLLIYGEKIKSNTNLKVRSSFTDLAATINDLLQVDSIKNGQSMKGEIIDDREN